MQVSVGGGEQVQTISAFDYDLAGTWDCGAQSATLDMASTALTLTSPSALVTGAVIDMRLEATAPDQVDTIYPCLTVQFDQYPMVHLTTEPFEVKIEESQCVAIAAAATLSIKDSILSSTALVYEIGSGVHSEQLLDSQVDSTPEPCNFAYSVSFKDGTSLQNSPFSFDPSSKLFTISSNGAGDATPIPLELTLTVSFAEHQTAATTERVDDSSCVHSACLEGGVADYGNDCCA